jgi:hypothetical protein
MSVLRHHLPLESFSALSKEFSFHLETLISDFEVSFLILFLESSTRDTSPPSEFDSVPEGTRAPTDWGFFPVGVFGGLGHPDPGLPGVEVCLADSSTSAGRGPVPHGQVDLSFKLL